MLKELLEKLAGKQPPERKEPRFLLGDGFYFEFEEVPNGYGGYRMVNVWLLKVDDPGFSRLIVDKDGFIRHFPGVTGEDWKKGLEYPMDKKIRFGFWIGKFEGGLARVRWTLQPDGRYFEDEDGFGAEDCEEITLYSDLDRNGRFVRPFSL